MKRLLLALLGLCFAMTSAQMGAFESSAAAVEPALQRFLSRGDEPLRQYRAIRRLEGHNPRFNLRGTLEAMTELTTDGRFTYTVLNEGGSEYIRNKVLRPVLRTEEQLFASNDPSRSALTTANYTLAGGEPAEDGLVKLFAKPKRKDISLIDGAVFVTAAEGDLVRVEGRMSKTPSFWATRVDLVRHYERLGGIRVPVRLDTTAKIRFAGTSTMSVVYDYESVNGVAISQ